MFKLSVCANMENVVELKLVDLLVYVLGEFTGVLPCKCTKSIWAKNTAIGKIASIVRMKLSFYRIFKQPSYYRTLPKILVLRNEATLITCTSYFSATQFSPIHKHLGYSSIQANKVCGKAF